MVRKHHSTILLYTLSTSQLTMRSPLPTELMSAISLNVVRKHYLLNLTFQFQCHPDYQLTNPKWSLSTRKPSSWHGNQQGYPTASNTHPTSHTQSKYETRQASSGEN